MKMKILVFGIMLLLCDIVLGQQKSQQKLTDAAAVLENLINIEETIPEPLIKRAEAFVILPKLINAGLGVGGKRGKGIAFIEKKDGSFSKPVFVQLTGGSIGAQAGFQKVDLILLIKDRETLLNLGKSDFTLGGEISVAAGPVGRNSSVRTNEDFTAEVLSYSKSKGIFAGISLDGALLKSDKKLNKDFYAKRINMALKLNEDGEFENESYEAIIEVLNAIKK